MYNSLLVIFWLSIFIVFYTVSGYGLLLWLMVTVKEAVKGKPRAFVASNLPEVTLLVAAYNEKDCAEAKVRNSRELEYPKDKLRLVWVTDGSDDGTPDLLRRFPDVTVHHLPERRGKVAAMNRAMQLIDTPIVIFSDANTLLGSESVRRIVDLFANPKVGCVAGEKRIFDNAKDTAAGAGEGAYWKYESWLKRNDARLYSVIGAAGELFAVRPELCDPPEEDTLLDDFVISLRIAARGFITQYDPEAYACETSSADIREELKRKVRIAAGGFQAIVRLAPLLNIFRYGLLSFQYISHRVLRWTLAPLCLPTAFAANAFLAWHAGFFSFRFYAVVFWLQVLFYAMAGVGRLLENRRIRPKILFVPYYFFIMNFAAYLGFFRYLRKSQDVKWERARRR